MPVLALLLDTAEVMEATVTAARLELHDSITAITESLQNPIKIRQEKNVGAAISRDLLPQSEIPGLTAKIAFLKELERVLISPKHICAWRKILHPVNDQIEIVERRRFRRKRIDRYPARSPVKHGGKLTEADRRARKLPRRAAALNHVFESPCARSCSRSAKCTPAAPTPADPGAASR